MNFSVNEFCHFYHCVWKSKKMSHSTLRAKRATFTFIKNAQNRQFCWLFEKLKLGVKQCYQSGHFWKCDILSFLNNVKVHAWCKLRQNYNFCQKIANQDIWIFTLKLSSWKHFFFLFLNKKLFFATVCTPDKTKLLLVIKQKVHRCIAIVNLESLTLKNQPPKSFSKDNLFRRRIMAQK